MVDWSQCDAIERRPGVVSGVWVFCGTRTPVSSLFENLRDGASLDEYLEWFPAVTRRQAQAVLAHSANELAALHESSAQ